jgi:hypothetical protein
MGYRLTWSTGMSPDFGDSPNLYIVGAELEVEAALESIHLRTQPASKPSISAGLGEKDFIGKFLTL